MFHHRAIVPALGIPTFLLTGCPAAPPTAPPSQAGATGPVKELIYGISSVEAPLIGATVRVTALDGTPLGTLATHADSTNHVGSFILTDAASPQDFRLVATGGTVKGVPFLGELRAEVRGHKAHAGYIALNPVTTLISAYMAAHPEKSLPDATAAVKAFLAIPGAYDVGFDLLGRPETFDPVTYASQAASRGGPLGFAQVLVAELDAGGNHPVRAARPYRLAQEAAVAEEGLAVVLGKEFAKGAASEAGGSVMGSVLSTLGLGGADASDAAFQAIYGKLQAIETKIDDLANAVTQDSNAIQASLAQGNYQASAQDNILKYVSVNQHVRNNLLYIAQLTNPAPSGDATADAAAKASVQADRRRILDETNTYIAANYTDFQEQMNNAMVGGPGRVGLIPLWSKAINAASPYFYSYDTAMKMQQWWDFVDVVQLDAVRVRLEWLRASGGSEGLVNAIMTQYKAGRDSQLGLLRGMVRKTDTMDLSGMGLPVSTITLKSIPGSRLTRDNAQRLPDGQWPVTIQKRDAANNPRLMLWRTRHNFADSLVPGFIFGSESIRFGRPVGNVYSADFKVSLWQKIGFAIIAAANSANVPGAAWQIPQADDVAALFKMPGAKGPVEFGFNLDPSQPLFTAPVDGYDDIVMRAPLYKYVNPADGAVQAMQLSGVEPSGFEPKGPQFTPGFPEGAVLMQAPLPPGVSAETLWYE